MLVFEFDLFGVLGLVLVGVVCGVGGGALVGIGGGRSLSTSLVWVGFLVPFWWGLGGWCGAGCAFPVVLLDTCLVFLLFLHGVNDCVFKEFGCLGVSPGSFFDSLGCCL